MPDALAVIDRPYNSLIPYRGWPSQLVYAVRDGARLALRHADFAVNRLVVRPISMAFPVDLIEIGRSPPGEFIAGRVVLILNEV